MVSLSEPGVPSPRLKRRLLTAAAVLSLYTATAIPAQDGVTTDKVALVALHTATDGANWTTSTNWSSDEPLSSWHGVTTSSAGRVTELDLDGNGLDGTLPAALGDLSELERLDLGDNDLRGALPTGLANLSNLASLLLDESRALTGALPDGLSELSDLETVNIDDTELCAPDDDAFQTWLATITFSGLTCPPAEQSVIDVAVFYTPAAREGWHGIDGIRTNIDLIVAETNQAFETSGVNQRVNLVAVEEVGGYTETPGRGLDLARLLSPSDGYMDEVHSLRDEVAADVVMLMRAGRGALPGGLAFSENPMSPGAHEMAFGTFDGGSRLFAHELGHILGLHHDRYVACGGNSCGSPPFPYSHGYVNQRGLDAGAPESAGWRTIMSYGSQCHTASVFCDLLLRFSNPDQRYPSDPNDPEAGDPLGQSGLEPSTAVDGPADAVRSLNRTRGYVANFRRAPNITVSFDMGAYTATEGGTAATVTVRLSDAPGRAFAIPLTATAATGATAYDYAGVPSSVRFGADATERTFRVTAVDDAADDDGETVTLGFGGALPGGVSAGTPATATVILSDNDEVTGSPGILSVELTSEPGGGYASGEEIDVTVRLNKAVTVTGTPQLGLTVGGTVRQASYRDRAGEVLRFVYTVADDDNDPDGVSVAADSLTLNGGTIRASANQNVVLTHAALADDADHRVDTVEPVLQGVAVYADKMTLTYDENLDATSTPPPPTAFRVHLGRVVAPDGLGDIPVIEGGGARVGGRTDSAESRVRGRRDGEIPQPHCVTLDSPGRSGQRSRILRHIRRGEHDRGGRLRHRRRRADRDRDTHPARCGPPRPGRRWCPHDHRWRGISRGVP